MSWRRIEDELLSVSTSTFHSFFLNPTLSFLPFHCRLPLSPSCFVCKGNSSEIFFSLSVFVPFSFLSLCPLPKRSVSSYPGCVWSVYCFCLWHEMQSSGTSAQCCACVVHIYKLYKYIYIHIVYTVVAHSGWEEKYALLQIFILSSWTQMSSACLGRGLAFLVWHKSQCYSPIWKYWNDKANYFVFVMQAPTALHMLRLRNNK